MNLTARQAGRADIRVTAPDDSTIMEALGLAGLHLDAPCGGQGRCGKCLVKANGPLSPPDDREAELLEGREGFRLACLAKGTGEVTVELEAKALFKAFKGLGWSSPYSLDPPLRLLKAPERDRQDQRSLLEALSLRAESAQALRSIGQLEADGNLGHVLAWRDLVLTALTDDRPAPPNLAVALDLGTTGLSAAIIDLDARETVALETALNPQTAVGADVISRITSAARSEADLRRLQDLALEGLADLISAAAGPGRAAAVSAAVVSGNTTMLHLLAGVNPKSLARAPYRPIFTKPLDLSPLAGRLGLAPHAKVLTSPSISSYIGGDITSGMLAVKLRERPGTVMFIDIGTNGEIVLSREGQMVATSCAAGPALEGMNISCGTRAITGAVDGFRLNDDLSPAYTTIGQAEAIGLCGSGLMDVCAELVRGGLIDKRGRFVKDSPAVTEGRYHLTDQVYFSQKDVRQVQLAKGAIAAAMKLLLEKLDLATDDLDEVMVAGSFGYHLRPESLLGLKLIPAGYRGPITFVGNSSLAGAARLLLDRSAFREIEDIAGQVEVMELGYDPKFQDTFLAELGF
jgi:uncharacterized 2Fe-2S/4Fe-4S cluster protein (DUF4445 family)